MGIVGTNPKETQRPAGKMKFTIILIGVMLLRGIELHKYMNWHGHMKHRTDPQTETETDYDVELNEIDELNCISGAVDRQPPVNATEVQKEFRSSPGDGIVNDGTEMAHDGKIMPKPGLSKNKLVAKYGTNFRYLGIVKNGIDRVTVVTSILIPRYENVKVKPINLQNVQ